MKSSKRREGPPHSEKMKEKNHNAWGKQTSRFSGGKKKGRMEGEECQEKDGWYVRQCPSYAAAARFCMGKGGPTFKKPSFFEKRFFFWAHVVLLRGRPFEGRRGRPMN